jgi:hypothetical protein
VSSDVGRTFSALQNKAARGLVLGEQYTVTVVNNAVDAHHDGACALEIDGYYPLFEVEAHAQALSDSNTAHTHTFNSTTYYMPTGGTVDTDYYHGSYTGGACLSPQINYSGKDGYWEWVQ